MRVVQVVRTVFSQVPAELKKCPGCGKYVAIVHGRHPKVRQSRDCDRYGKHERKNWRCLVANSPTRREATPVIMALTAPLTPFSVPFAPPFFKKKEPPAAPAYEERKLSDALTHDEWEKWEALKDARRRRRSSRVMERYGY